MKGQPDIVVPYGVGKDGDDEYRYLKLFIRTYIGKAKLCPEFIELRDKVRALCGVELYGIQFRPYSNGFFGQYNDLYRLGTMSAVSLSDEDRKQIKETLRKITGRTDKIDCGIWNETDRLKWFFLVDTIYGKKDHWIEKYGLYDIEVDMLCKVKVVFDLDEDLIANRENGTVRSIAQEIMSVYSECKIIDIGEHDVSIQFTSFESEAGKSQKPYRSSRKLFSGSFLLIDEYASRHANKVIKGCDYLSLTHVVDARGYSVLQAETQIFPVDKTDQTRYSSREFIYPPDTEINETNWSLYMFPEKGFEDYPKFTLNLKG